MIFIWIAKRILNTHVEPKEKRKKDLPDRR